jgi:hypothetical protein
LLAAEKLQILPGLSVWRRPDASDLNTSPVGEDEHSTFGVAAGHRCVRSRLEDLCDVSEMPGSAHTVSIADDFTSYVMENLIHAGIPPNAKVSE